MGRWLPFADGRSLAWAHQARHDQNSNVRGARLAAHPGRYCRWTQGRWFETPDRKAGEYQGIVRTTLDGFDQRDYLEGKSDKSAREVFFYYSGSTPSAVRYKNWKIYYSVSQPGAAGWLEALVTPHFPLIQNIKRDPFEQFVDPGDTKSLLYFGGSLAAPSSAFMYDGLGIMPLGQLLWLKELESYVKYPPLQHPETYNLTQIMQQVRKMHEAHAED